MKNQVKVSQGGSVAILFALFLGAIATPTYAQRNPDRELLVYFRSGMERTSPNQTPQVTSQAIRTIFDQYGITISNIQAAFPRATPADTIFTDIGGREIKLPNFSKIYCLRVPGSLPREPIAEALRELPDVLFAELNGRAVHDACLIDATDPYFSDQWGLENGDTGQDIHATQAWDIYQGSSSNKIGIIDVGTDATHPDLLGKVIEPVIVYDHHGTHVAGIATAYTNNGEGIAGVDWNARIIAKSFFDGTESGDEYISQIVMDAVYEGAHVLNNSWKLIYDNWMPGRNSTTVRMAFAFAYKINRVAVASMGNTGPNENTVQYPGHWEIGIIGVGATDDGDQVANFSTRGDAIDVAAPGVDILSTYRNGNYPPNSNYHTMSGTSMAVPHTSGTASLLKGYAPILDNDDIKRIIELSADDVNSSTHPNWDNMIGHGRLNAEEALKRLMPPYSLDHYQEVGGTDMGETPQYLMMFYGAWGLEDGEYFVKRHEVRWDVTFPLRYEVEAWARGYDTDGWALENPNFGLGWAEVIPGSVSNTSSSFRSYVYEVWVDGGWEWHPEVPRKAAILYTTLGLTEPSGLPSAPTGLWGDYFPPDHGGPKVELQWNRNPPDEGVDKYRLARAIEEGEFNVVAKAVPDPGSGSKVYYTDYMWIPPGTEYVRYKVRAHNYEGWGPFCDPVIVECDIGPLMAGGSESPPTELTLDPNYPNPFNPTTQIKFGLPAATHVRLQIMNVRGQTIRVLVDEQRAAGWYTVTWDSKNESGRDVASGIYLYLIEADNKKILKKLTLIR